MTDPELVSAAIKASGLSASAFARDVLVRNPRTVFRMLKGETPLSDPVRAKCEAIVAGAKL
jgi:hypothetical protein